MFYEILFDEILNEFFVVFVNSVVKGIIFVGVFCDIFM